MAYLGIFGLSFQKTMVIFEISTIKFVKLQNLPKKKKISKFGTKMTYLSTFQLEFSKAIVVFEISTQIFEKFQSFT